jgi:tetratricopeptide (TPR) repeat protein
MSEEKENLCSITLTRGFVGLAGQPVSQAASDVPNKGLLPADLSPLDVSAAHVTLFSKALLTQLGVEAKEAVAFAQEQFKEILSSVGESLDNSWIDLGVGKASTSYYKVVCWPVGQFVLWRLFSQKGGNDLKKAFQGKDFHITIGTKSGAADVHDVDKGVGSIVPALEQFSVEKLRWILGQVRLHLIDGKISNASEKKARREICLNILNDAVAISNQLLATLSNEIDIKICQGILFNILGCRSLLYGATNNMDACLQDGERMITLDPKHPLGYVRCGEAHSSLKEVAKSIEDFHKALNLIGEKDDEESIDLNARIAKGMNFNMKQQMSARINPRKKFDVFFIDESKRLRSEELARNFSWVIPGQLAGMSVPHRREQIEALRHLNVRMIFTVMDESPLPSEYFSGVSDVMNIYHPVRNYGAPTVEQVDDFISKTEGMLSSKTGAVLVHCGGGKGRAGTFLSCWLSKHGKKKYDPDDSDNKDDYCPPVHMTAQEAIDYLRDIRPGSVETQEQEKFVAEYVQLLWKRSESENKVDDGKSEEKRAVNISPNRKKVRSTFDIKFLFLTMSLSK